MELDMTKMVEKIAMQAKENQEEFIFETIRPYCEDVLQMKINKKELKQILLNGMQKQQPCEDCISREDAKNLFWDGTEGYDCRGFTRMEIGEMLDDLSSVTPKTRWISVSEKLPEESGRYLVTRGLNACGALWNRVYIINYSDLMGLKSERIWWSGNVGKSDFERIDDVKAWQPLPEPYKAESEE
jgi:hypothetical protein